MPFAFDHQMTVELVELRVPFRAVSAARYSDQHSIAGPRLWRACMPLVLGEHRGPDERWGIYAGLVFGDRCLRRLTVRRPAPSRHAQER